MTIYAIKNGQVCDAFSHRPVPEDEAAAVLQPRFTAIKPEVEPKSEESAVSPDDTPSVA